MSALLPKRRRTLRSLLLLSLLILAFASAFWRAPATPVAGFAEHALVTASATQATTTSASTPAFASRFVSHASERFVHAASMTALPDGGLFAAWFGGTREGADDVRIYGARFDPVSQQWSAEQVLVTSEQTAAALGIRIRKLGNPVLAAAPDGRLWLIYVSVSLGGWATSNLNLMTSDDGGNTWSAPKRLVMTPFFNLSTLVRGKPLFHTDGSLGVPVYHEALAKFPEYARIDRDGRVLDKVRMDFGRETLQPYVVALSETEALALLRDDSPARAVSFSRSSDAGRSWNTPQLTTMPNPNAAIAAVRYSETELLVALNDMKKDRYRMSLYRVDNALQNWQLVEVLDDAPNGEAGAMPFDDFQTALSERFLASAAPDQQALLPAYLANWSDSDPRGCKRGQCEFRYDYPYLLQTGADRFELMYSWNKSMIKHVTFSRDWVDSKTVEGKAVESQSIENQAVENKSTEVQP